MAAKERKQWWNPYETSHRRQFVYQPTSAPEILLHKHPVSTTFKDSSSHPGPLGSTVYNEEYYWKPQCKPNHICTGTASGHWRNNPHPRQEFFVWRFPRDTPRCSAASTQKGVPCDGEICKALGAQYCSIYTRDFKGSSQGPDESNKQDEKLAPLRIRLQKRESLPADTEMRASYRPPKQKPELLPNIYQHSNMDQRALCRGIVPTVIQRHVHTQQRGTNQTTYDRFYGNSVNYLPPDIKALRPHESQQLKTILHDEGQETGKAVLGKNTCLGNRDKTKELAAALQNPQSPVWTSSWPGPL
ncbi:testis-expressed protein 26 [Fundulus diaphanus]